jgi:hypothetical protein
MRLQVRIDVRQPLKKETRVKDKEGRWCVAQFKYEKLGIFCFVCGVMGHVENKCEVRFSMEQDDGVRGWSAEIRADNRKQGGRFTSWWLKEDGGGSSEILGGERRSQPQTPFGNSNMGPTHNNHAATSSNETYPRQNPNHQAITTQHENSLAINGLSTQSAPLPTHGSNNYHNIISQSIPISIPHTPAITTNQVTPQPLNLHNNLSNPFGPSDIQSSIINHQFTPIFLNRPDSTSNQSQSLTNQILSFSSQPLTATPHPIKTYSKINSRAPTQKNVIPRPTFNSKIELNPTRLKPEKNTTKIPKPNPNPTQTESDPSSTQMISEDMETQTEKNRRREDEVDVTENLKESEHFLTAGLGSQAYRDQ